MPEKQFKLIRTIKTVMESPLTTKLNILKQRMERLQRENPENEFAIVDADGKPVQILDFVAADLASPVNRANRRKAAKQVEQEQIMRAKVRRF